MTNEEKFIQTFGTTPCAYWKQQMNGVEIEKDEWWSMKYQKALPNQVDICGIPYSIEYVGNNLQDDTGGLINCAGSKILINREMSYAQQKRALIHEIVHGIFGGLGYMDEYGNEQLVSGLAMMIDQIFELKEERK